MRIFYTGILYMLKFFIIKQNFSNWGKTKVMNWNYVSASKQRKTITMGPEEENKSKSYVSVRSLHILFPNFVLLCSKLKSIELFNLLFWT